MTALTLNEIRICAAAFAKDFGDASRENAESQIFWNEFFQAFGLPKRRVPPGELAKLKVVKARVQKVREMRIASTKAITQKLADKPTIFGEHRQVENEYLLIPRVSSERRKYVPVDYLPGDTICSDANFMLPNAQLFHFAILCSHLHMAWMRYVCGRLKSDFRYSNAIV